MVHTLRSIFLSLALSLGALACAADVGLPRPQGPLIGLEVPVPIADVTVAVFLTDSACSGVVVGPNTVLTARHCLRGGASMPYAVASTADGLRAVDPEATVVSGVFDLMVVELAADEPPFTDVVELTDGPPALGGEGWAAGYGCSGFGRLDVRPVRYVGAADHYAFTTFHTYDEYRGRACHGDSGGGVFDQAGRLVGITSAVDDEGHVYVVPVYNQD